VSSTHVRNHGDHRNPIEIVYNSPVYAVRDWSHCAHPDRLTIHYLYMQTCWSEAWLGGLGNF
jgi:hypothetical protein